MDATRTSSEQDDRNLAQYSAALQASMHALQQHRMITINHAQALRRALPVIGIFALLAGAMDGVAGVTAALAGGLAGLQQGDELKYRRAWNKYQAQTKALLDQQKGIQEQIQATLKDKNLNGAQIASLLRTYEASYASEKSYQARIEAAGIGARSREAVVASENANRISVAGMRDATSVEVARLRAQGAQMGGYLDKTKKMFDYLQAHNTPASPAQEQQAIQGAAMMAGKKGAQVSAFAKSHPGMARRLATLAIQQAATDKSSYSDALKKVLGYQASHGGLSDAALKADAAHEAQVAGIGPASATAPISIDQMRKMTPEQNAAYAAAHGGLTPAGMAVYTSFGAAEGRMPYISYRGSDIQLSAYNNEGANILASGGDPYSAARGVAQYKATGRSISDAMRQQTGIRTALGSFRATAPLAVRAASELGLNGFTDANAMQEYFERAGSNPTALQLSQYINDLASDYATIVERAPVGTANHELALEMASTRISRNLSPEGLQAVIDAVETAAQNDEASDTQVLQSLGQGVATPSSMAAPMGASSASTSSNTGWGPVVQH